MLFEEDGNLHTVYNLQKTQMEWWKTVLLPLNPDPDVAIYNLWETATSWGGSDQWGFADKSFYTDTEYYGFPRPRLLAESANRFPMPSVDVPVYNGPSYTSKPQVWDGTQWVSISNVMVRDANGNWVEKRADIIQYYSGIDWT
jgi:hypothetical protein